VIAREAPTMTARGGLGGTGVPCRAGDFGFWILDFGLGPGGTHLQSSSDGQTGTICSTTNDVAPVSEARPVAAPSAAVKLELDNDEIIQFSLKPSPWFIARLSAIWVLGLAVLGVVTAVAMRGSWEYSMGIVLQVLASLAAVRIGVATLEWASRYYVLTNRRVMRLKGIFTADVVACPLAKISRADLLAAAHERVLRLGTIRMESAVTDTPPIIWENLAHPAQVHETLLRAIGKAQRKE
jgi:membrane protein YdbS with pleckstrin-like domain